MTESLISVYHPVVKVNQESLLFCDNVDPAAPVFGTILLCDSVCLVLILKCKSSYKWARMHRTQFHLGILLHLIFSNYPFCRDVKSFITENRTLNTLGWMLFVVGWMAESHQENSRLKLKKMPLENSKSIQICQLLNSSFRRKRTTELLKSKRTSIGNFQANIKSRKSVFFKILGSHYTILAGQPKNLLQISNYLFHLKPCSQIFSIIIKLLRRNRKQSSKDISRELKRKICYSYHWIDRLVIK